MKLSIKQKAALVRMLDPWWLPPKGDGRTNHGFSRTLYSLKWHGLVEYCRNDHGWILTEEGLRIAIIEKQKLNPRVEKEATR
jgi:hypothetical protein